MASLGGYHGEISYDRFKDHIERNLETGHEAQGSPAKFASFHRLTQYWSAHADDVQEIVSNTGDLNYQIEDIRKRYLRIFSILVWISMTGRSYVRYLKHFVRNGKEDPILPFRERPAFFPSTTDSEVFWTTFFKHQWMFCPVQLGPRGIYDRDLHPNQILPFSISGDLGSPDIGRPAKIRLAKVHASEALLQTHSTGGNLVLKSYDTPHENSYHNEIRAYHAFSNAKPCENILKYIGSYYVQPLAPGSGLQYTIMLEHAERGSLLDLYGENDPPIRLAETKAFWSSLLQVAKGLMVAHNTIPKRTGASCVHQDLKPSNIFVFDRDVSAAKFDLTLKIGDFGNSHTRKSAPYNSGVLGYDRGSTRTYCPPELYWNHQVDFIVGPLQDMWSLGCVLIEAAVWVCFGQRGRVEFQQRRRDENDEVAPEQRDLGRGDCFHNGTTRLKAVSEVLSLTQRDGRKSDELTPKIVKLVLDHVLVDEDSRLDARILSTELGKMIRTTTDCFDDRSSHRISGASSATHSHRSQEFRLSQHDGIDEQQSTSPRSPYESLAPSTTIDSIRQSQTTHTEGATTMGMLPNRGSVRSQLNPAEAWNHNTGSQRLQRTSSGQLSITSPEVNGLNGIHCDQSTTSPVVGYFHSDIYGRAQTGSASEESTQHHTGHTKSSDQPWPAQRAPTIATNRSNSTVTHSQLTDHKRATFPEISMELVDERRAEGKSPKSRRLLRGEDQAMIFLKQRDHILLINNSKHMREFKGQVLDVFANLAHILEAADPNGLDVMCTSDPGNMQHSRATDKLVQFFKSNFDKCASSPCFIERALKTLADKVIDKLPSGPGEKKGLMSWIKNDKVRSISIYVLTSGVWNSPETAREGTCGAERPISQLIAELQSRNLHKSQIAIQFIRFGNHPTGVERLIFLDDCLGKPHYDIVDHKPSDGSVWPMLIGSLDEGNDREDTD